MFNHAHLIKYIPGASRIHSRIEETCKRIFEFFRKQLEEHKHNIDKESEPTDYIDAYLRESERLSQNGEKHTFT